jgi:hypothetical protein
MTWRTAPQARHPTRGMGRTTAVGRLPWAHSAPGRELGDDRGQLGAAIGRGWRLSTRRLGLDGAVNWADGPRGIEPCRCSLALFTPRLARTGAKTRSRGDRPPARKRRLIRSPYRLEVRTRQEDSKHPPASMWIRLQRGGSLAFVVIDHAASACVGDPVGSRRTGPAN